jgi:hypothetical protein
MFFSDSTEFICALLASATKPPMLCWELLAQPKNPKQYFKIKKDKEIYLPTTDETYHSSTSYIHKPHKQPCA